MRPKNPVGVTLVDPVLVHVGQKIEFAVRFEELVNPRAFIGRDRSPIVGLVWRRGRVILSATRG